jgi:hypothetical protein
MLRKQLEQIEARINELGKTESDIGGKGKS